MPGDHTPSEESRPASPEPDTQVTVPVRVKHEGTIDSDDDEVELIEVKVKQEDGSEQFKYVHLMKSEDGMFDVFNTDGFDLGQRIKIDALYNMGWSRKVISDVGLNDYLQMDGSNCYRKVLMLFSQAFFGGHQTCFHNWAGKKAKGEP